MMWANVAGIVSTWTFNDPPKYHKPATINLVFSISEIKRPARHSFTDEN